MQLGWLPTLILIVGMFFVNMYTAMCMFRTRNNLVKRNRFEEPKSFGDVAYWTMGYRLSLFWIGHILVYFLFGFLIMCSYLLLLGGALQDFFRSLDINICLWECQLIGFGLFFPTGIFIRSLNGLVVLTWVNFFLILFPVVLTIVYIIVQGPQPSRVVEMIVPTTDVQVIASNIALSFFAYSGQWMYFEVIYEMGCNAKDFPYVFTINGPVQVIFYLVAALIPYFFRGQNQESTFLLYALPTRSWYSVIANLCVFLHTTITYFQTNIIVSRMVHLFVDEFVLRRLGFVGNEEDDEDEPQRKAGRHFKVCSVKTIFYLLVNLLLFVCAFVVANSIPFFSSLNTLIGAVVLPLIALIVPVLFLVASKAVVAKRMEEGGEDIIVSNAGDLGIHDNTKEEKNDDTSSGEDSQPATHQSSYTFLPISSCSTANLKYTFQFSYLYKMFNPFDLSAFTFVLLLAIFVLVFGTWGAVVQISTALQQTSGPFTCYSQVT
eukprot:g2288.t1